MEFFTSSGTAKRCVFFSISNGPFCEDGTEAEVECEVYVQEKNVVWSVSGGQTRRSYKVNTSNTICIDSSKTRDRVLCAKDIVWCDFKSSSTLHNHKETMLCVRTCAGLVQLFGQATEAKSCMTTIA